MTVFATRKWSHLACGAALLVCLFSGTSYGYMHGTGFASTRSTIAHSYRACALKASPKDDEDAAENSLPQLPAIGSSSFDHSSDRPVEETFRLGDQWSKKPSVASEKFELQYTCKICDTRNSHRVSRIAYRTGVVIAVCKGCMSKHLIADNLGWSNYIGGFEGETNIEEYMANRGLEDSVKRVSKNVFELEKVLGIDSESGSIVGDGGEPAME